MVRLLVVLAAWLAAAGCSGPLSAGSPQAESLPCFFCGRPAADSAPFHNSEIVGLIAPVCGFHSGFRCHRICFLWNLAHMRQAALKFCFLCRSGRVAPPASPAPSATPGPPRPHTLLAAVMHGAALKPEHPACGEALGQLTGPERRAYEHLHRGAAAEGAEHHTSVRHLAVLLSTAGARSTTDERLSQMDDAQLHAQIMDGRVAEDEVPWLLPRLGRQFFSALSPGQPIAHFALKILSMKFLRQRLPEPFYSGFLDGLVRVGFPRLRPRDIAAIFSRLFSARLHQVLCLLVNMLQMYHVQLPPGLIRNLMCHVAATHPDSDTPERISLLAPFLGLSIDWPPHDQGIQQKLDRIRRSSATHTGTFFYEYVTRYSSIPLSLPTRPFDVAAALRSRPAAPAIGRLSCPRISAASLARHFQMLDAGQFSVDLFRRAMSLVSETNNMLPRCRLVLAHYFLIDYFWQQALLEVVRLAADHLRQHSALNLLRVLLASHRCTPEAAWDILRAVRETGAFFPAAAQLVCGRVDFSVFPRPVLLGIFGLLQEDGRSGLLFEFLLNLTFDGQRDDVAGQSGGHGDCCDDIPNSQATSSATPAGPFNEGEFTPFSGPYGRLAGADIESFIDAYIYSPFTPAASAPADGPRP